MLADQIELHTCCVCWLGIYEACCTALFVNRHYSYSRA